MPKITVDITDEQAELFKEAIAAGEYTDTPQIFTVALSRWEIDRFIESPDGPTVEELRALWDEGKASGPAVPIDWDEFRREADRRLAELKSQVA